MTSGRKWFFLCVALVFIIGFLTGIITGPLVTRPMYKHMTGMRRGGGMPPPPMDFGFGPGGHGGPSSMGEKGRDDKDIKYWIVNDMSRELSLSSDQKNKLRAIFDQNEPEQLAFHKKMRTEMNDLRKKMDAQILQILDDKQKKKFKEITNNFENHDGHGHFEGPGHFEDH
jgi:hypothetical protein